METPNSKDGSCKSALARDLGREVVDKVGDRTGLAVDKSDLYDDEAIDTSESERFLVRFSSDDNRGESVLTLD